MPHKFPNLPPDSREEIKKTAYLDIQNKKYRIVYTMTDCIDATKDILKIDVNSNLNDVVHEVNKILKTKLYQRIHLYLKYKYFAHLNDSVENVYNILKTSEYNINFAFVLRKYKNDDYVLIYDIFL